MGVQSSQIQLSAVALADNETLEASAGKLRFKNSSDKAQGDTFFVDGSGDVENLAIGTSGKFLKSQGAGNNPTWDLTVGNFAFGLTAGDVTQTNMDTDVSDEANMFDDDYTSVTTEGLMGSGSASNTQVWAYVKIDLGETALRNSVRTKYELTIGDGQAGNGVGIEVSNDDTNWDELLAVSTNNRDNCYNVADISGSKSNFRYVRFKVGANSSTGSDKETGITVFELQVS